MAQVIQKPTQKQRYKVTDEPFEILQTARKQVAGEVAPPETLIGGGQQQKPQQKPQAKPSVLEKKAASHMTAFRQELEEIKELQKKREEEMRQRWSQQEELKKQREEEAKKAKSLIEPVARVKRGVLGGMGKMFGLGKKQRSVELPKTPTN
ncbi:MAG: hypothetical protein Q7S60_02105 [bacterium]|nr:hypothetical protein [bacterium]